jgi:hypothetical protein
VGLIRQVLRFGLVSENSILRMSIPSRAPGCRSRADRSVQRFLAGLAALLVLTPWLLPASAAQAAGARGGPRHGIQLAENASGKENAPAKSEAAEAWDAVKDTTDPALLEAFIQRYGTTFFADIAKSRLDQLKAAGPAPAEHQNPIQMPTDGVRQRAVLYEEDPSNSMGRRSVGVVVWRTETIKADGKPDEFAVHADIDIPASGLQMMMSLRRNLDPSLPASHVIELTLRTSANFVGGGIANVPGVLTKSNEQARGVALAGLSVKVAGGFFMVGLSNGTADRNRNQDQLLQRSWFDIPLVYANQRRAILAIDKGESGEQVFRTVFSAWGQYPGAPQPAAGVSEHGSSNGGAR